MRDGYEDWRQSCRGGDKRPSASIEGREEIMRDRRNEGWMKKRRWIERQRRYAGSTKWKTVKDNRSPCQECQQQEVKI